ncbi:MAG: hypothetical protein Q9161_005048 [Pseudevernia consocians]
MQVLNVAQPSGKFWGGIAVAGDHYDIIGGAICGSFVVFGGLSVLLYKPWRRGIDRKRERHLQPQQLQDDKELGTLPELKGVPPNLDVLQRDRESPTTANDVKGNANVLEAAMPPTFSSCNSLPSRPAVV